MNKRIKKILLIDRCKACYNFEEATYSETSGIFYVCRDQERIIDNTFIEDANTLHDNNNFPDWCPLESKESQ